MRHDHCQTTLTHTHICLLSCQWSTHLWSCIPDPLGMSLVIILCMQSIAAQLQDQSSHKLCLKVQVQSWGKQRSEVLAKCRCKSWACKQTKYCQNDPKWNVPMQASHWLGRDLLTLQLIGECAHFLANSSWDAKGRNLRHLQPPIIIDYLNANLLVPASSCGWLLNVAFKFVTRLFLDLATLPSEPEEKSASLYSGPRCIQCLVGWLVVASQAANHTPPHTYTPTLQTIKVE